MTTAPRRGYRLGIDLGGTQVKLALVDNRGHIAAVQTLDTVTSPSALARRIRQAVHLWRDRPMRGTGVGVAGDVDSERGRVRFAPNLCWRNVPLADLLRRHKLPKPLVIENDANAAAWGAFHVECGGKYRHLVALTLGTGVGGGLVLEGRLYRGASGSAGELGHMVVESEGIRCACGNRGCLEAYVGGAALVRWARGEYRRRGRAAGIGPLSPKILAERALTGDVVARAAWRRVSHYLGVGLANLVNLLNPQVIVLTGGVVQGADLFLPEALRNMKERAFQSPVNALDVRCARESATLGVIGAALLVP